VWFERLVANVREVRLRYNGCVRLCSDPQTLFCSFILFYLDDYLTNYMECVALVVVTVFPSFCHVIPLIMAKILRVLL
jgi:hypothetical protein